MRCALFNKLKTRGKAVHLVNGKLQITPVKNDGEYDSWMGKHRNDLLVEVASIVGQPLYRFVSYTVTYHPHHKDDCLSLFFEDVSTGTPVVAFFNVKGRYSRVVKSHKKGDRLPVGHFVPAPGSEFIKFYHATRLPRPDKASRYNRKLHLLKKLLFIGNPELRKGSFRFADKSSVRPAHILDISMGDGHCPAYAGPIGGLHVANDGGQVFPANSGAARDSEVSGYVSTQVRNENKVVRIRDPIPEDPNEQTPDEWIHKNETRKPQ